MGTIFVGSILFIAVSGVVANMIHKKKTGKSSCGCSGCNGSCGGGCGCSSDE